MTSVIKEVFANYIYNLTIILGAEPAVIILDKPPCHRNIDLDFPEVEKKFWPPYSPFLNPIENKFEVCPSSVTSSWGGAVAPAGGSTSYIPLFCFDFNETLAKIRFRTLYGEKNVYKQTFSSKNQRCFLHNCKVKKYKIFWIVSTKNCLWIGTKFYLASKLFVRKYLQSKKLQIKILLNEKLIKGK